MKKTTCLPILLFLLLSLNGAVTVKAIVDYPFNIEYIVTDGTNTVEVNNTVVGTTTYKNMSAVIYYGKTLSSALMKSVSVNETTYYNSSNCFMLKRVSVMKSDYTPSYTYNETLNTHKMNDNLWWHIYSTYNFSVTNAPSLVKTNKTIIINLFTENTVYTITNNTLEAFKTTIFYTTRNITYERKYFFSNGTLAVVVNFNGTHEISYNVITGEKTITFIPLRKTTYEITFLKEPLTILKIKLSITSEEEKTLHGTNTNKILLTQYIKHLPNVYTQNENDTTINKTTEDKEMPFCNITLFLISILVIRASKILKEKKKQLET